MRILEVWNEKSKMVEGYINDKEKEKQMGLMCWKRKKREEVQKKKVGKEEARRRTFQWRFISDNPQAHQIRVWNAHNVNQSRTTVVDSHPCWKKLRKAPCHSCETPSSSTLSSRHLVDLSNHRPCYNLYWVPPIAKQNPFEC